MQPNLPQTGGPQQPPQEPKPEQQGFYTPTSAPAPVYQPQAQTAPIGQAAVAATQPQVQPHATAGIVSWQASEYIHRSKDATWVISFGLITLIFLAGAIWLQAWFFAVLIVVMAAAMGYVGFRQPKVKQYTLTHDGLQIDNQMYKFTDFRAFGVVREDAVFSVQLIPIKRLVPAVTVYFAEADGESIVDLLGAHLPIEQIKPDLMDNLTRRLHF